MFRKIAAAAAALLLLFSLAACGISYTPSSYVQVYETTGTKSYLLSRRSDLDWEASALTGNATVTVDLSEEGQTPGGFGATMTHSSAYLLMQADEQTRSRILNDLFSADGANSVYSANIIQPANFLGISDAVEGKLTIIADRESGALVSTTITYTTDSGNRAAVTVVA